MHTMEPGSGTCLFLWSGESINWSYCNCLFIHASQVITPGITLLWLCKTYLPTLYSFAYEGSCRWLKRNLISCVLFSSFVMGPFQSSGGKLGLRSKALLCAPTELGYWLCQTAQYHFCYILKVIWYRRKNVEFEIAIDYVCYWFACWRHIFLPLNINGLTDKGHFQDLAYLYTTQFHSLKWISIFYQKVHKPFMGSLNCPL